MTDENKKRGKKCLVFLAKVTYGVVVGAAALGAAPFDRGYTARCVASSITNTAGSVFSEMNKWAES